MHIRVRRHTIHTFAVLAILGGERKRTFTAGEVAERCQQPYGCAYSVLRRLFDSGYVARFEDHGEAIGHSWVSYQIAERGLVLLRRMQGTGLSNPAAILKAWTVEDPES